MEEMDPDELEDIQRAKEARDATVAERRRKKDAEEKAVADRHKKLDKAEAQKQAQRLEYLLKQSSIFSKLKMEHHEDLPDSSKGNEKLSHHRAPRAKAQGKPKKTDQDMDEDEDSQEDEEEEQMVFLTKQPLCIKFGTLKPYQLEALNWMIHLAQKGLNGILAGAYTSVFIFNLKNSRCFFYLILSYTSFPL